MLGPVVGAELLRSARRGRAHILVWLFAGWVVLQLLFFFGQYVEAGSSARKPFAAFRDTAAFARAFVDMVVAQQFLLVALAVPAFVAGAITDEKARGTLQHLLTTRLTPGVIVWGKLCARVIQVGALALVPLPLVAALGPFAGVTPEFLLLWLAVTALLVIGLGAVSVLASVWTRQTRQAVLLTYFVLAIVWLFARGPAAVTKYVPATWREALDPLRPLAPAWDRADEAEAVRRLGSFAFAWGGVAVVFGLAAAFTLRPVYVRQLGPSGSWLGWGYALPRPVVGTKPISWKEFHVGRRIPAWLGLSLTAGVSAAITYVVLAAVPPAMTSIWTGWRDQALLFLGGWVGLSFTVVIGVRASGSICGERERRVWETLMATPLATQEIVRGKLHGILRAFAPYVVCFGLTSAVTASCMSAGDPLLAFTLLVVAGGVIALIFMSNTEVGALTTAVVVVLFLLSGGVDVFGIVLMELFVTGLAMYVLAAVGLFCSAHSNNSWRSLLATVALGYVGGSVLFVFLWAMAGFLGSAVWWLGVALAYWGAAQLLLDAAERHIHQRDRLPTEPAAASGYEPPLRLARPAHRW